MTNQASPLSNADSPDREANTTSRENPPKKIVKIIIIPGVSPLCRGSDSYQIMITEDSFFYSHTKRFNPTNSYFRLEPFFDSDDSYDSEQHSEPAKPYERNDVWRYKTDNPRYKTDFIIATQAIEKVFTDQKRLRFRTDCGITSFTVVFDDGSEATTKIYDARYCSSVRELYKRLGKLLPAFDTGKIFRVPQIENQNGR